MKKTKTYSKQHHVMEQSANKFDDVLAAGRRNPTLSSSEPSLTDSPSRAEASSMEEEEFLTLSSRKCYSGGAISESLCKKQEMNKESAVPVTSVTAGNTPISLDKKRGVMFHEEESFPSGSESRYTYMEVTVTNTDYLSSPELVREEDKSQREYPAARSLIWEDPKADTDYTEAASLLSDEDDYSDNQLLMDDKEQEVDFEQKPQFTSTLLDPVSTKDGQAMAFSQVLSTIGGADSDWDENSSVKQVSDRMASMRSTARNRKAFTIKGKAHVSVQPKTSTLLVDEGERPTLFRDDLSTIVIQSAEDASQPSYIGCQTAAGRQVTLSNVSMKKQTCDTNSNQSPIITNCGNRIAKMTSTPTPEEMSSPFTLNLSPINSTCSSSELYFKQSGIVDSDEVVFMDTDSEQEMLLAKAEINQIRESKATEHPDVCGNISEQTSSAYPCCARNKQKKSAMKSQNIECQEVPLCCIVQFPDNCTNLPGRRLMKTTNNEIDMESVPDDILETFGENPS